MNKPRGRRSGSPDTRAEILRAARERFLSDGYSRASLRSIAAEADVDVALLSYHFGSKQGLFAAAMQIPVRPGDLLEQALNAPIEQWPERILRTVLLAWEDPRVGPVLVQTVLANATQEGHTGRFDEFLETEILRRLATRLAGRDAEARAAGVMLTVAGLLMARYVIRVPTIAGASTEALVHIGAPSIAAHLRGARLSGPRP